MPFASNLGEMNLGEINLGDIVQGVEPEPEPPKLAMFLR